MHLTVEWMESALFKLLLVPADNEFYWPFIPPNKFPHDTDKNPLVLCSQANLRQLSIRRETYLPMCCQVAQVRSGPSALCGAYVKMESMTRSPHGQKAQWKQFDLNGLAGLCNNLFIGSNPPVTTANGPEHRRPISILDGQRGFWLQNRTNQWIR